MAFIDPTNKGTSPRLNSSGHQLVELGNGLGRLLLTANPGAQAANAVYTSASEHLYHGPNNRLSVSRVVARAVPTTATTTNGFEIQFSHDNSTWVTVAAATVAAGAVGLLESPVLARYCRVRVANGPAAGSLALFAVALVA